MSIKPENKEILSKITELFQQIRKHLQINGRSAKEIANFFECRIFACDNFNQNKQYSTQSLQKCIKNCLQDGKKKGESVYVTLTHILTKLEIEHSLIKEREKTENTFKVTEQTTKPFLPSLKFDLTKPTPPKLTPFDVFSEPQEQNPFKMMRDLHNVRSFQRQLHESIRKTKELKRLLQQKMMQEMEDKYISRIRNIHQLLAMEGSS